MTAIPNHETIDLRSFWMSFTYAPLRKDLDANLKRLGYTLDMIEAHWTPGEMGPDRPFVVCWRYYIAGKAWDVWVMTVYEGRDKAAVQFVVDVMPHTELVETYK